MSAPLKVCIVGAGIIGLSVAEKLLEVYSLNDIQITIISEHFLPQTTSFCCGGLWEPYAIAGTPPEDLNRWGQITFERFRKEYLLSDGARNGVSLTTVYSLFEEHEDSTPPSWYQIVHSFTVLSKNDIEKMGLPKKYTKGYSFGSYVVDQKYFEPYLMKKLATNGVTFLQRKLENLNGLIEEYDCVINCSGLGAYHLVPDTTMYPIRGQVLRVRAPWMKSVWLFGSSYIIPNVDTVVLGGTADKGNWSTDVSLSDTKTILSKIAEVFPSLAEAPVDNIWVGLRPGRSPVRLDSQVQKNRLGKEVPVIHCYGHGGSGVTLSVGCAHDVVNNLFTPWYHKQQLHQQGTGMRLSDWMKYRSKL